jgi:hypothetical protein
MVRYFRIGRRPLGKSLVFFSGGRLDSSQACLNLIEQLIPVVPPRMVSYLRIG